jgi:Acetyl-CoA carboxylase, carboxyltransferase component (subunits alpha and beta)
VEGSLGGDTLQMNLRGPKVHSKSGVVDLTAPDELGALKTALRLLSYLPDNNHSYAPFKSSSLSLDDYFEEEALLLHKTFANPTTGFNTPFDMRLFLQQLVDHGDYFQIQEARAKQLITAFGRMGGHVVGFVANNSAFDSGNIDTESSRKGTKFIRFCNLFNIPVIFLEDVSGYAPGSEQEHAGVVQAGRELLDSIVDLRVPRLTLIVRNAFGGAYCAWNSHHIGADFVFALPSARIAVMGPAGRQFVYKEEYRQILCSYKESKDSGLDENKASAVRDKAMYNLTARYEQGFANPEEALRQGSVSKLMMPGF